MFAQLHRLRAIILVVRIMARSCAFGLVQLFSVTPFRVNQRSLVAEQSQFFSTLDQEPLSPPGYTNRIQLS